MMHMKAEKMLSVSGQKKNSMAELNTQECGPKK